MCRYIYSGDQRPGLRCRCSLGMNTHRWPHSALLSAPTPHGHHTHCRHQIVARLPANWGFIGSLGVIFTKDIKSAEMSTPDCVPPPSCIPPVAMKAGDVEAAHIVSHSPSHGGSSSPAQPSPAQPSPGVKPVLHWCGGIVRLSVIPLLVPGFDALIHVSMPMLLYCICDTIKYFIL